MRRIIFIRFLCHGIKCTPEDGEKETMILCCCSNTCAHTRCLLRLFGCVRRSERASVGLESLISPQLSRNRQWEEKKRNSRNMISFYYFIDLNNFVWIDHVRAQKKLQGISVSRRAREREREGEKYFIAPLESFGTATVDECVALGKLIWILCPKKDDDEKNERKARKS